MPLSCSPSARSRARSSPSSWAPSGRLDEELRGCLGFPFAIEGLFFFLEAIFVAIYIYGWDRMSPWAHFWSGSSRPAGQPRWNSRRHRCQQLHEQVR
ncbi:cytochrome ubiquinol oxidase subunit I [Streptomyces sp. NPDC001970]